jgi:hypothetical protein
MTVSTGTTALFTAPDGTTNADKIIATSGNVAHNINRSGIASAAYTFSVFAKAGEESVISLWLRGASVKAEFNLVSGTVSNITTTSARIENYGNGWYRCTVYDSTAGTTAHVYGRGGAAYAGNGSDGFYLWGAQLETGSIATSYIPTTAAAVTRNAEVITLSGAVSGCIGQTEGTIYAEVVNTLVASYAEAYVYRVFADANNEIWARKEGGGNTYSFRWRANSQNTTFLNVAVPNGVNKIAFGYKSGDTALFLNGSQVATTNTDVRAFSVNPTTIALGSTSSGQFFNDRIRAVALYTTRLTNDELDTLTTL